MIEGNIDERKIAALEAELQQVKDALHDVLDVCDGWVSPEVQLSPLSYIEAIARAALEGTDQ